MTRGILLAACVLGAAAARSNETTYLVFFNKVPKCGSGSLEAWFDAAVADGTVIGHSNLARRVWLWARPAARAEHLELVYSSTLCTLSH